METRSDVVLTSEFFQIPPKLPSEENHAYEKRLIACMVFQLNQLLIAFNNEKKVQTFKSQVADDLVALTHKIDHHIALYILFEASRHPLFLSDVSHLIINKGIQKENYHRSPINKNEKSLKFLRKFQGVFPAETNEFLKNPERLLIWLNEAPSLEIGRVFEDFYPPGTEYYLHMRELAQQEYDKGNPYKAFICFSIMAATQLSDMGKEILQQALHALNQREPDKFRYIAKSIVFRIHFNYETLRNTNGHYVNGSAIKLTEKNLDNLKIDGARLIRAQLDSASMNACSLIGAQLEQASLIKTSLIDTNMQHAYLQLADLTEAELMFADLRGTDFSRANLSHSNLSGTKWNFTVFADTDLTGTIFFNKATFKFPETLESELTRLNKMLHQNNYAAKLHDAILADLLHQAECEDIPKHYRVSALKTAYDHPIFNSHTENHTLKLMTNKANRWFFQSNVDDNETKSQIALHAMLTKLDGMQYKNALSTI